MFYTFLNNGDASDILRMKLELTDISNKTGFSRKPPIKSAVEAKERLH